MTCWGAGSSFGQLGIGYATSQTPVAVPGLTGLVGIFVGSDTSCAVLGSGGMSCWGDNGFGQVGDGTTLTRTSPTTVPSFTGVAQPGLAGSGPYETCTLMNDGTVDCWGYSQDTGRSTSTSVVWP